MGYSIGRMSLHRIIQNILIHGIFYEENVLALMLFSHSFSVYLESVDFYLGAGSVIRQHLGGGGGEKKEKKGSQRVFIPMQ